MKIGNREIEIKNESWSERKIRILNILLAEIRQKEITLENQQYLSREYKKIESIMNKNSIKYKNGADFTCYKPIIGR